MTAEKDREGGQDHLLPDPRSSGAAGQTDGMDGADLEARDANGWTPLHLAASSGRAKVVNLLLDRGADIDARDANGCTPLHDAASSERAKVVNLLLDRGADIDARDANGCTPLYRAAILERVRFVNLLADRGADIDARDANGCTPLYHAAILERVRFVNLLADRGADIDARDATGQTALHWAVRLKRTKVVNLLLDRGADIEARDASGKTPLHHAASSESTTVTALLLDRGADIDAKDVYGRTALHEAASSERTKVAALLLDRGADIDAKDPNGSTPLHDAAMFRSTKVVNLLLDRGADLDSWGAKLLLDAADGDDDMASLLRDRGITVAPKNGPATNRPDEALDTGGVETTSRSKHGERVAVGCLVALGLFVVLAIVGALVVQNEAPEAPRSASSVPPGIVAETSVDRNEAPEAPPVRPVQPIPDHARNEGMPDLQAGTAAADRESASGREPGQGGGRLFPPVVVAWATWEDPIAPTIHARRTLFGRGDGVILRTRYSDGTSHTEKLIERPSGKANERRFEVEPDNDQSEYITVTDSGVVRWFAWDGTNFLTQRASWIHADFLALGANPAQRECTPKQLPPTLRKIVTLYEQLQDFKDHPDFAEFGFSDGGPYHQWMENAATAVAEPSPDERAIQLDHLGFTSGDVMNLGLSYLNPEIEEEQRNILHTEGRIRAGLALATCDSSVAPQN